MFFYCRAANQSIIPVNEVGSKVPYIAFLVLVLILLGMTMVNLFFYHTPHLDTKHGISAYFPPEAIMQAAFLIIVNILLLVYVIFQLSRAKA